MAEPHEQESEEPKQELEEPQEQEGEKESEEPKQELEEPQEQELRPEDVKDKKAKAFVRRVIKTLANLINETDNEELKRLTHDYIYCFENFYTLVEMARYMTSRYKVHVNSVIQIFQNAFLNNDWACHPYWAYSSHREALRKLDEETTSIILEQAVLEVLLAIQTQLQRAHKCGPDCNHDEASTSQPSKVNQKHRKPRKR